MFICWDSTSAPVTIAAPNYKFLLLNWCQWIPNGHFMENRRLTDKKLHRIKNSWTVKLLSIRKRYSMVVCSVRWCASKISYQFFHECGQRLWVCEPHEMMMYVIGWQFGGRMAIGFLCGLCEFYSLRRWHTLSNEMEKKLLVIGTFIIGRCAFANSWTCVRRVPWSIVIIFNYVSRRA